MGGNALVSGGFIEHTQAPAELRVDTTEIDVDNAAHQVLLTLENMGLIGLN